MATINKGGSNTARKITNKQKAEMGVMKCSFCREEMDEEEVYCSGCEEDMHFGKECSGLLRSTWMRKGNPDRMEWRCPPCKKKATQESKQKDGKENDNLSQKLDGNHKEVDNQTESEDANNDWKDLTHEDKIDKLLSLVLVSDKRLQVISSDIKNMKGTMKDNNEQIKKLQAELKSKDRRITQLETRLKKVEEKVKRNQEDVGKSDLLFEKFNDFDQYQRNKNYLEIHNIPEGEKENTNRLTDYVINIGNKVGVELKEEDVEAVHRINSRNQRGPRPIIVQLARRKTKDAIFDKKKKTTITQNDILENGSDSFIYVNQNLTQYNKKLFYESRKQAKERNYAYCWFKKTNIFIKPTENSQAFCIKTKHDLEDLLELEKEESGNDPEVDENVSEGESEGKMEPSEDDVMNPKDQE